jgi:hypothetical protein
VKGPAPPAGIVVDQIDDAAHHDLHRLGVAPGLARAVAHRLDRRGEGGEVVLAAADPPLGEPPGAAQRPAPRRPPSSTGGCGRCTGGGPTCERGTA